MKQKSVQSQKQCINIDDLSLLCSHIFNVPKSDITSNDLDMAIKIVQDILKDKEKRNQYLDIGWELIESSDFLRNIFSNLIFSSIEIVVDVVPEAKKILMEDLKLLFLVGIIIDNIYYYKLQINNFNLKKIDVSHDPDTPDWTPLRIKLKIKSDNFKERLKIKHEIRKRAFHSLNEKVRKNIYITGAI